MYCETATRSATRRIAAVEQTSERLPVVTTATFVVPPSGGAGIAFRLKAELRAIRLLDKQRLISGWTRDEHECSRSGRDEHTGRRANLTASDGGLPA